MSDKINKLLSQYWDIAYQEGAEGRKHDTINYDAGSVLAAIQFEVSELEKELDESVPKKALQKLIELSLTGTIDGIDGMAKVVHISALKKLLTNHKE